MRSKLYKLGFAFCLLFTLSLFHTARAQCSNRYLDTIFLSVDSFSNIVYTTTAGGSTTELMDIYQPTGDTACLRHLIIWLHGGAFFQGTKNDGDVQFLSERFGRRGYVCATINYRLASSIVALYDSAQIFKYAYEAYSDLKAAIRYFYKDASLTNHWNIDTNAIFIGGSSAGGIAVDFAATLDSLSQLAPAFQTIATSNGGIDGNSGNAGYSTKVIGVASLAGAVNTIDWIKPGAPPMVLCQGTADGTVPYECGLALTQYTLGLYPTINFCGSGGMAPKLDSVGVRYSLLPFPGSGHVPWDTNVVIENRMDSAVAAFFYSVNCVQAAGHCNQPLDIKTIAENAQLNIYPIPASDHIRIAVEDGNELSSATLYDYTGREVDQLNLSGKNASIPLQGLTPGIYILKVNLKDNTVFPITRKIQIE